MKSKLGRAIGCAAMCAVLGIAADADAEPRTHDGFYMKLAAGLGYYSLSSDAGGVDQSISGVTMPTSLMMGSTFAPGLVIGGGMFLDYGPSPSIESGGMEIQTEGVKQFPLGIGVFADYYLDPAGGTHFQGFVGWGGVETSSSGNVGGSDPTGLVLSVAGGYDWFISDEWSAGVMGRLAYGAFSYNDAGFPTIAPALLGTLTYH